MQSRGGLSRTAVVLTAALAAVAALLLLAGPAGVLFVAPAIAAVLMLAAGWFPGAEALVAIRERRRSRPRAALSLTPRRADLVLGRLLSPVAACAAGRAPPHAA